MKKLVFAMFLVPVISIASSIQLTFENDALGAGDDSDYSHGTEIIYMTGNEFWYFNNWGIGINQNMYTPEVIETKEIQYGDHPYCGYLSVNFIGDTFISVAPNTTLTIENWLGLGTLGKNSLAKESQDIVHKILGHKKPLGWDNQIEDEVVLQYQLWLNLNTRLVETKYFDLMSIPRFGLMAGGFKDELALGYDLKFGISPNENIGSGLIMSAPRDKNRFMLYGLAGVEGKCVFHDSSLDGGLFKDSVYTLDSETWVGELRFGVGLQYNRFELNYLYVMRSKEYKTQDENPNYGRISIKYSW